MENKENQNNQNQNKQNQNNQNDNGLFTGICLTGLGIFCLVFMKEDVYRILGLFDLSGKTMGIIALVIGGWNLLTNDGFGKLLGEIIALPFRLLAIALEYWYVTIAIVALFFWLRPETEEPEKETHHFTSATEAAAENRAEEITATVTVPPAKVTIHQPYPGMSREAGLCKNLREDATLLLVFVNDSASTWTAREMDNFTTGVINPGLEYIEYRASEYGYGISFENCFFTDGSNAPKAMNYNGTVYDLDHSSVAAALPAPAAEAYGFGSVTDMIESARNYAGTNQVAVAFCLDKPGRSYSHRTSSDPDYVEYAVIFSSWQGINTTPKEVAHEVLHLFGADDMYAEGNARVNRAALAKKLNPKELFYEYQRNLYDNTISSYTAYAVGWLDTLPVQYDCPEWWS